MTLGEKIQDLRRRYAMSQDALAERLEVSRQAVSKWERDEAVPETEKIIRIAQVFGVSTDYLLMDREPEEQPWQQTQQQTGQSRSFESRAERFVRRHGYKAGYIMAAAGALVCVICLLLYFLWPVIGGSLFGSFTLDPFTSMVGQSSVIVDGDLPDSVRQQIGQSVVDSSGIFGSIWNSGMQQMENSLNSALKAQASLFLIGLVPGLALLAAGGFIAVKGKKLAADTL